MLFIKTRFLILFVSLFALFSSGNAAALTTTYIYLTSDSALNYGSVNTLLGFLWSTSSDYDIANGLDGKTVTIQSRKSGNPGWGNLTSVTTTPVTSSGVTYTGVIVANHSPGFNTQYRALFNGDETYASSASDLTSTNVKSKVSLKGKVNNSKQRFEMRGSVTPTHRGKKVLLKMKKKGGGWSRWKIAMTDSNGKFYINWPYQVGTFYFVAYFSDSDHAKGKSQTVWIKVT